MRFALITIFTLALVGCGDTVPPFLLQLPTAPNPPVATTPDPPPAPPVPTPPAPPALPRELTFVWVIVLDDGSVSGTCIPGAKVDIVRGQGVGRSLTQSTRGCDSWHPDYDALFPDLYVGEELTLRASAAGYAANEKTVSPTPGGQFALPIVLSRIR
jgi:hypothetical protein